MLNAHDQVMHCSDLLISSCHRTLNSQSATSTTSVGGAHLLNVRETALAVSIVGVRGATAGPDIVFWSMYAYIYVHCYECSMIGDV